MTLYSQMSTDDNVLPFDDLRPVIYVHVIKHGGVYLAASIDGVCFWNGRGLGLVHNVYYEVLIRDQLDRLPQTVDEARKHLPISSNDLRVIEEKIVEQ